MPKTQTIPCSKQEMDKLIEVSSDNPFYHMLFIVARTTGRRIGELYGEQKKIEIGKKIIGNKIEYDRDGKEIALARMRTIYKRIPNEFVGGVKVKDVSINDKIMRVWVLKRRKLVQDETILGSDSIMAIKFYLMTNKLKDEDYLFREVSYRGIQDAVKRYGIKAGINHKVSIHNFRHYFVTELKRKGWSNDMIAKLTGHKTISSLSIYDHIVAGDIKEKALKDIEGI